MAERLATLNYELTLVKAGLDEEGDTFSASNCATGTAYRPLGRLWAELQAAITHHMAVKPGQQRVGRRQYRARRLPITHHVSVRASLSSARLMTPPLIVSSVLAGRSCPL